MVDVEFYLIESYLNRFGEGTITLSKECYEKGLAILYINNPKKRNAISGKMMVALRHCVLELEQWKDGKAVLLCGVGGNFCSGADLDFARASGTQQEALYMSTWMQDTLKRLGELPLVTFCLLQGPTLGGGAEISVFCDFLIFAEDVKYGFVHGKMAIITAWGGTTRLVQKIGYKKALKLLLSSEVLNVSKCVENEIADYVVPAEDCLTKAIEWIDGKILHNANVVRSFKQAAQRALTDSFENALDFEKQLFSLTWGSDANKEALAKNIKHVKMINKM